MTVKGNVQAFLGIPFNQQTNGHIQLQQISLIDNILKTTGLQYCNPDETPASQKPLDTDHEGGLFNEQWSYTLVTGMLLYLAVSSCPAIA